MGEPIFGSEAPNPTQPRRFGGRASTESCYSIEPLIFVTQDFGHGGAGACGRSPGTCRLRARLLRGPHPPGQRQRPALPARSRSAHPGPGTRGGRSTQLGAAGWPGRASAALPRRRSKVPLPRPMATRARPDAEASFAASRRAPDFRFRLPLGRAHARTRRRVDPPVRSPLTLCADWAAPAGRPMNSLEPRLVQ